MILSSIYLAAVPPPSPSSSPPPPAEPFRVAPISIAVGLVQQSSDCFYAMPLTTLFGGKKQIEKLIGRRTFGTWPAE